MAVLALSLHTHTHIHVNMNIYINIMLRYGQHRRFTANFQRHLHGYMRRKCIGASDQTLEYVHIAIDIVDAARKFS